MSSTGAGFSSVAGAQSAGQAGYPALASAGGPPVPPVACTISVWNTPVAVSASTASSAPVSTPASRPATPQLTAALSPLATPTTTITTTTPPRIRTTLCRHYSPTEDCPYGNRCFYAHGRAQLGTVVPTHVRTALCHHWLSDHGCWYEDDTCAFAHGREMLDTPRPLAPLAPLPGARRVFAGVERRTRLCEHYMASRSRACPHGQECTFAHGEEELGTRISRRHLLPVHANRDYRTTITTRPSRGSSPAPSAARSPQQSATARRGARRSPSGA